MLDEIPSWDACIRQGYSKHSASGWTIFMGKKLMPHMQLVFSLCQAYKTPWLWPYHHKTACLCKTCYSSSSLKDPNGGSYAYSCSGRSGGWVLWVRKNPENWMWFTKKWAWSMENVFQEPPLLVRVLDPPLLLCTALYVHLSLHIYQHSIIMLYMILGQPGGE